MPPLNEQELLIKHNIRRITASDVEYPSYLKEIHCPPPQLYVQGELLNSYTKLIAVVGSRKADSYGERVIASLVPELVAHGWAIVSGGALGADSFAHKATLQARGRTIVILGSGLLMPYPSSNRKLFSSIVDQGGSLVSSFSLDTPAYPSNFPARNRIISGMSRGVIVAQAAEKSGARITAHLALEQGREVFAIPGPIDHALSIGCNRLIQQGAKLVQTIDDIFTELGEQVQAKAAPSIDLSAEEELYGMPFELQIEEK